jgi:hypothetical protein
VRQEIDGGAKSLDGIKVGILGRKVCPVEGRSEDISGWSIEQLGGLAEEIE